jgi:putative MATE family efflux protein
MALDSNFYRKMLGIAIPVVLQDLLVNSLTFIDTLMIGQLGTASIAAVGLANQLSFLINLFFFGVSTGASIFIAQYYGADNKKGIGNVMALGTLVSIIGATVFCILALSIPDKIMRLYTKDENVVALAVSYLRYIGPSFFCLALTKMFSIGLRSTGNPVVPLGASILSMVSDIILNYFLIFGIAFFPEMGVRGAALATTLSRLMETVVILTYTYRHKSPCAITERSSFRFSRPFLHSVIPTCIPVVCNEFFWAVGMTIYKIAYGKLGTEVLAAVNVNESVSNMFFTAMFGVANSSLIMIGQKIGEKRPEEARVYCRRFLILSCVVGAIMGVCQALFSPQLVRLFSIGGPVALTAQYCLYTNALLFPLRSFDTTMIVGVLRSGGDTRYSMLSELGSVWLIGIPMAFLGCTVFKLPIWYVYLLVGLEEVSKGILGYVRVKSGRWLKDLSKTA